MNEIVEIMENTDLRSLKKQQLIKINSYFGNIYKKKQNTRKNMIEQLIPIQRKIIIYKNIIGGNEDCPICFKKLNNTNYIITTCGHAFCTECIYTYVTKEKEICPICRKIYRYRDLVKPFTSKDIEYLFIFINNDENIEMKPIENAIQQRSLVIYIFIFKKNRDKMF